MKIQLNSNGQIINPPLRVAQRYIRLGRACLVEEVKEVIEVKTEIIAPKIVETETISADFEEHLKRLDIDKPVKVKKPKKSKKE